LFKHNNFLEPRDLLYNIWFLLLTSIWIRTFIYIVTNISIHQNHPTFHHANSPYNACSGGNSAIWISNTLHKVEGRLNVLILLSLHGRFYMNIFNAYNFLLLYACIIIILSVVKLAIATGHAMQVFNDLHCSNRCRFISIAWSVATASLYHWILYNVYIKILKPVFHFDVTYRSISFCVEVISSTLVLRKQRNSGKLAYN
jgi:hypothetical protein